MIFQDPTPTGIINQRFVVAFVQVIGSMPLNARQKTDLVDLLFMLGRKLASVWTHKDRYQALQAELVEQCLGRVTPQHPVIGNRHVSQDLFLEFDEFLVQGKSLLDYLVKAPVPLLGPKAWRLRTFANKGEEVIRALRNNVPKLHRERARGIAEHLIRPNQVWIRDFVDARDKVNHFLDGGISIAQFVVWQDQIGSEQVIRLPMWSEDQTVAKFMDVAWWNMFRFTEDFFASSLSFASPVGWGFLQVPEPETSMRSPWSFIPESERPGDPGKWNSVESIDEA